MKLIYKYLTGNKILPTAQYASIKYDRGTKHIYPNFVWDSKLDPKKDIRGVRANNPLHSEPGEIMREILYSPSTNLPVDTTYREYPTALLPVKIQTRVASSNDLDRKEYEILKRRFDTAWKVSRPHISYGIFKEGGMIPKYLVGAYFVPYKDGRNTNIMGRGSGKRYTVPEVKNWLKEHNIEITDKLFDNWFVNSNPISYMEYLNWNKSLPTQDKTNKFQWNNKYWSKISNKYKGLEYNKYMQEFNKWFDQQNFNSLEKDNRNYIAKQNWDKYVQLGYNKPVNVLNDVIVTQNKDSKDDYLNDNNIPPVLSSQQGFTPELFFDTLFGNQEYAKKFKLFLGIPDTSTEPETVGKQPEDPTYESLVKVNTASMNDNINSGNFRRLYRKAFNEALLNGTIYGANNPNGTLVFDSNAVIGYDESENPIYATADNIMQKYGLDGKISRRDMRMLRKDIIRNLNLVRMNNVSNFLGITSPAVVSPTTEEVVSTLSGVYLGATPEETANLKLNYDWSKTI